MDCELLFSTFTKPMFLLINLFT